MVQIQKNKNYFDLVVITAITKNPATMSVISAVNCRYLIIGALMHHMKMM